MDAIQVLSLTAVLFLALYGAACVLVGAARRLLRPQKPALRMVLELDGDPESAEVRLRYALELSRCHRLPLCVIEKDLDAESERIVSRLLANENAERIRQNRV